jgi:hypothetical protein
MPSAPRTCPLWGPPARVRSWDEEWMSIFGLNYLADAGIITKILAMLYSRIRG